MTHWKSVGFLALVFTVAAGPDVPAYRVHPVENGGAVTGKVWTQSPPPKVKKHPLLRFPNREYCGRISDGHGNRDLPEFFIDPSGGLKNVVVALEGVPAGKPFPKETAAAAIHTCRLEPFVLVFWKPYSITVRNLDPLFHTLLGMQTESSRRPALFYLPLKEKGTRTVPFRFSPGKRIFALHCSVHPYSQLWGFAVENPYFDVTKENGSFRVDDVPPGTYTLSVWHPTMKISSRPVSVSPGSETRIEVELEVIQVDLPLPGLSELEFETPPGKGGEPDP
jgi:hypothetical protein